MAVLNIITQKMIFGGKTLGKINGKTVFVPFALPGEELNVEITKSCRDYDEAKIVEIVKPSPHRVEPKCPLYQKCGGCNMMHIAPLYQVELKKQIVEDIFARAGIALPPINVIAKSPFGYRNRMELHDGGLEERGSNNVIPIDQCPIAAPEINEWLGATPVLERPHGRTMLFGSKNSVAVAGTSLAVAVSRGRSRISTSKTQLSDINPITVEICGKKISFDVKGFFQSNIELLEAAIPIIMEEITKNSTQQPKIPLSTPAPNSNHSAPNPATASASATALDLYSGCGMFSAFFADNFKSVTMVEHNKGAVAFAEQNLAGKEHASYAVSCANFVKYHAAPLIARQGNFDLAFADPPRSGLEKEVCEWLCKSDIPKIAYLSCDPSTQARDVAFFIENGYTIKSAWLLDFYPQTGHIETFLKCEKNENN